MKYDSVGKYILVKPDNPKTVTKSGVYLPEERWIPTGTALSIGDSINYSLLNRRIHYVKTISSIKINDENHVIVHIDDVMGIIEDDV